MQAARTTSAVVARSSRALTVGGPCNAPTSLKVSAHNPIPPVQLDLGPCLPLPDRNTKSAAKYRHTGATHAHGTAEGHQGHRHDHRVDGALCDPDARRLW